MYRSKQSNWMIKEHFPVQPCQLGNNKSGMIDRFACNLISSDSRLISLWPRICIFISSILKLCYFFSFFNYTHVCFLHNIFPVQSNFLFHLLDFSPCVFMIASVVWELFSLTPLPSSHSPAVFLSLSGSHYFVPLSVALSFISPSLSPIHFSNVFTVSADRRVSRIDRLFSWKPSQRQKTVFFLQFPFVNKSNLQTMKYE